MESITFTDEQIPALEASAIAAMKDNGHALISPSGASIWMGCMGSTIGIHDHRKIAPDNSASVEGTCGHFLLEICLLHSISPLDIQHIGTGKFGVCPHDDFLDDAESWYQRIVSLHTNDESVIEMANKCYKWVTEVSYPPDMRMEVARCYDIVQTYIADGWTMIPEMKVKLRPFLGHDQCDGTSDVVLYKGDVMIVADLKYGIAIEVNPTENKQMKIYAAGAIDYVYRHHGIVINELSLVVMQPRINDGVWKIWNTCYADLHAWMINEVKPASLRSLYAIANPEQATDEWFTPSESACKWCHRKRTCSPRRHMALENVKKAFELGAAGQKDTLRPLPFDPDTISDDQLAKALDYAPFISAWFSDAEKEALRRTKRGHDIGGRKMVVGRVKNSWSMPDKSTAKKMIELGASPDLIFEMKLKSFAKIKATNMPSDVKTEILKLNKASKGGDVLALANDPREAVTPLLKAKKAFAAAEAKDK